MLRIDRISPATTGFVTTIVLTCALAVLAAAMWVPRGAALVATGDEAAPTPATALPVQQAVR